MEYRVIHRYRSSAYGPFEAGATVDLTEVDAEWVNRDSPGCLEPVVAEEPASPELAEESAEEPVVVEAPVEVPKKATKAVKRSAD